MKEITRNLYISVWEVTICNCETRQIITPTPDRAGEEREYFAKLGLPIDDITYTLVECTRATYTMDALAFIKRAERKEGK